MLFKYTILLFAVLLSEYLISPSYSGVTISCERFEDCVVSSLPLNSALTPSSAESVWEIDPSTFSSEYALVESPIFKDGFEEGLSGPLVSTVIIGPQGGDFNLSNGINLSIPADAVPEETTFQFRVVQETEVVLPAVIFKTHGISYLGGFEATPYGYMFDKPISISIPSAELPNSIINGVRVKCQSKPTCVGAFD